MCLKDYSAFLLFLHVVSCFQVFPVFLRDFHFIWACKEDYGRFVGSILIRLRRQALGMFIIIMIIIINNSLVNLFIYLGKSICSTLLLTHSCHQQKHFICFVCFCLIKTNKLCFLIQKQSKAQEDAA